MTDEQFFALLLNVMYDTRKNKRYGRDSIDFEYNWAPLLVRMMRELMGRTFRIDTNYAFLTSIPKWREIFATFFQGRISDHLICDTLMPYVEMELHPRTFNNRKGKGSQAAINQVIEDICEASNGYQSPARIIKWDLKGFFPNANLDCMEQFYLHIVDKYRYELAQCYGDDFPDMLKWLTMVTIHCCPAEHCELRTPPQMWAEHIEPHKSLFNKPQGTGAPIGRMTSQMGMGLYINDEVRWLNDECGIRTVLFMDDGVMSVPESQHQYALSLLPILRKRLADKGVMMNDRKFYNQPYQHGLEFLGTHIHPWSLVLNDCTFERGLFRIEEYNEMDTEEKYRQLDRFISTVNSYTGQLKNRTQYGRICQLCDVIADDWWQWLDWDQRRLCVVSKPQYTFRQRLCKKYNLKLKQI